MREQLLATIPPVKMDSDSLEMLKQMHSGAIVGGVLHESKSRWVNGKKPEQVTKPLWDCPDLLKHMMGGQKRIEMFRSFLKRITNKQVLVHISTHGYVNEVDQILTKLGLRGFFTYLHGMDDAHTNYIVVGGGHPGAVQTYRIDSNELDGDKYAFIKGLIGTLVVYADDSDDCLVDIQGDPRIWWLPGLLKESGGLSKEHLSQIEEKLEKGPRSPVIMSHLYVDPVDDTSSIAFLPLHATESNPRALIIALDVSGSMEYERRLTNAMGAIAAIAPRYAMGGVFVLPWSDGTLPMITIEHPGDEEEVLAQLKRQLCPDGGTNYSAAVQTILFHSGQIVDTLSTPGTTDITLCFITDSTVANSDKINFDLVTDDLRQQVGNRVRSISLVGINVFGAFGHDGDEKYLAAKSLFQSFRHPAHHTNDRWCTIHTTDEIDTTLRVLLGASKIDLRIDLLEGEEGTSMRISGVSGDPVRLGGGTTVLQASIADRQFLCLIFSRSLPFRAPIEVTIQMDVGTDDSRTFRLQIHTDIPAEIRGPYIQRMYQAVRTNTMETVSLELRRPENGFGRSPDYVNNFILPTFRTLREEHAILMTKVGIRADDPSTSSIYTKWSQLLDQHQTRLQIDHTEARVSSMVHPFDPLRAETRRRFLIQTRDTIAVGPEQKSEPIPATEKPVRSVYRSRRPRNVAPDPVVQIDQLNQEINTLSLQITEHQKILQTGRIAPHQYLPRRYLASRTLRPQHAVDLRTFARERGECHICTREFVNLYSYVCCIGKVCGACGVDLLDTCPFCRASPTGLRPRPKGRRTRDGDFYSEYIRYDCQEGSCVRNLNGNGTYKGLADCEKKCSGESTTTGS